MKRTTLYRVRQQPAATFIAQAEDAAATNLPQFVKDEFDAFQEGGILALGFLIALQRRRSRRRVKRLARATQSLDVEQCLNCGGQFKIIAADLEARVMEKIPTNLGLEARAPSGTCHQRAQFHGAGTGTGACVQARGRWHR